MRKILFVDDVPSDLQDLKKKVESIGQEWEVKFVGSGEGALNVMAISPFDVVVSSLHMQEMNGVKLLDTVMEQYPETVRIIYSDHTDKEMVLKSAKSAHQFLLKTSNAETIKYTIERTCKLQDLLSQNTLKKWVTKINNLPSYPVLYGMIMREMQSEEPSLKKVGYIISQDVSMSAKILQLVNSAFFGLPKNITDPQQAVVYLGINTLKSLVLSIDVFSSFTEDAESSGFSLPEMWKHSLMTGRLAMNIARDETNDGEVAEQAMAAGMLHDVGKLVLLRIPGQYKEVVEYVNTTGCEFTEAEYFVMKTSHAELGAYLLGLWGLPENVVEAVAFHHNPSKFLEDTSIMQRQQFSVLTAIHVANSLLLQESFTDTTDLLYIDKEYLNKLNLMDKLPKWVYSCEKMKQEED